MSKYFTFNGYFNYKFVIVYNDFSSNNIYYSVTRNGFYVYENYIHTTEVFLLLDYYEYLLKIIDNSISKEVIYKNRLLFNDFLQSLL